VPSSEAGGHTQYQPKSGIFKSAVLDHFHIGADKGGQHNHPQYPQCLFVYKKYIFLAIH
jgi:hypothetical protein